MGSLEKSMNWRIIYVVCCLVYMGWVVYLSLNNFGMVHKQYRLAQERLQPVRIEEIALQDLVDKCRKKLKRSGRLQQGDGDSTSVSSEDPCLSFPAAVLAKREKTVKERLVEEKSRVSRKLVWFYITFGVVFLILPMAFVYLLVSFFIWLYRNIKFVE